MHFLSSKLILDSVCCVLVSKSDFEQVFVCSYLMDELLLRAICLFSYSCRSSSRAAAFSVTHKHIKALISQCDVRVSSVCRETSHTFLLCDEPHQNADGVFIGVINNVWTRVSWGERAKTVEVYILSAIFYLRVFK